MYQKLTGEESVHLDMYPELQPELMDDHVEERMDLVRTLVGLGRASREEAKIKVRQPIGKVMVDGKYEDLISDLVPLIQEELNVKEVVFEKDLQSFMNFSIKPNFRAVGPKLGKKMGLFGKALAALDGSVYAPKFEAGESVALDLGGEEFVATADDVQVTIQAKEGFNVAMEDNHFLILDTNLSEMLIQEGYAREVVSKVQNLRKSSGFEVTDHIKIYVDGDSEITAAVEMFGDYIKQETLAESIEMKNGLEEAHNLNGHQTGLAVERV
jgi:isoleucyl-tRNA synthetase